MEGRTRIMSHECGFIAAQNSGSLERVLSFLAPQLSVVVPLVEANRGMAKSPILYDIELVHEHNLSVAGRYKILHADLVERPEGKEFLAATL